MKITVNPLLHAIVEREAVGIKYGTVTFNIAIKGGVAIISTLNLSRVKRRKYEPPK
jgi:hypothetical protein